MLLASASSARRRAAVAMSGGIDSAVSALLLKQQGYDCVGVFMKNWDNADESDSHTTCTVDRDRKDMQEICARLDIPVKEVNFVKEYWNDVFSPMLDSYKTGLQTPNPDVVCNRTIKFHHFREFVFDQLDVDVMATGHYARCVNGNNPLLLRGKDSLKDQSYFLSMTRGESFRNVIFPVGHLTKASVKEIAHKHLQGLAVLNKPESMGLCFVGKRDMGSFLGGYLTLTPGHFIDLDTGIVVGEHHGKELFTVGQGARIAGAGDRYFVTFCEPSTIGNNHEPGDVFVVKGATHPKLFSRSLSLDASQVSWLAGAPPPGLDKNGGAPLALSFKARYNQTVDPCEVHVQGDSLQIVFGSPSRAITPGQVCALYDGDVVLGGGIIRGFE